MVTSALMNTLQFAKCGSLTNVPPKMSLFYSPGLDIKDFATISKLRILGWELTRDYSSQPNIIRSVLIRVKEEGQSKRSRCDCSSSRVREEFEDSNALKKEATSTSQEHTLFLKAVQSVRTYSLLAPLRNAALMTPWF